MAKTLQSYCPSCDREFTNTTDYGPASLEIRGEHVDFVQEVLHCPYCGAEVGDSRVDGINLERARDVYRAGHGILSRDDIKDLRRLYGLSVRDFGRFLGFGEQTITKYEAGSMPDELHNNTLRWASTAYGAKMLLSDNRLKLSEAALAKVERRIGAMMEGEETFGAFASEDIGATSFKPSSLNGFRGFDIARLGAVARRLAASCASLYVTKLQKALYFCDALACERLGRSVSGAVYVHGDFGPMLDRRDLIHWELEERGYIRRVEDQFGELVLAGPNDTDPLSNDEWLVVDEVSAFCNSFTTTKALVDYSHNLSAWRQTSCGAKLRYNHDFGEIERSVVSRLSEVPRCQPSIGA